MIMKKLKTSSGSPFRGGFIPRRFHKIDSLFLGASFLMLSALASCSSDEVVPGNGDDKKTGEQEYYISLSISVPDGETTRAEKVTDSDEQEGTSLESKIEKVDLYFCVDDKVVCALKQGDTDRSINVSDHSYSSSEQYNKVVKIKTDVNELTSLAGKKAKVILIANKSLINGSPTYDKNYSYSAILDLKYKANSLTTNPMGNWNQSTEATELGKLMPLVNSAEFELDLTDINSSNAEEILSQLRRKFTVDKDNPGEMVYPIPNVLSLERSVARLDFSDISRDGKATPLNTAYSYKIGASDIYLTLDKMTVFNVNKLAYLFRHTSPDGTSNVSPLINNNWRVGADCSGVNKNNSSTTIIDEYLFLNPLTIESSTGKVLGVYSDGGIIKVTDIDKRTAQEGYYPWMYINENIIPTAALMSQDNLPKYATGVAFTFKVMDKAGNAVLPRTASSEEVLPNNIKRTNGGIRLIVPDGKWQDVEWSNSDNAYTLTYYGFIKHSQEAANQYAIVRNHIYRMKVESVNSLPDGQESMTLQVRVKPWEYEAYETEW